MRAVEAPKRLIIKQRRESSISASLSFWWRWYGCCSRDVKRVLDVLCYGERLLEGRI